jgi:hypothetical protein
MSPLSLFKKQGTKSRDKRESKDRTKKQHEKKSSQASVASSSRQPTRKDGRDGKLEVRSEDAPIAEEEVQSQRSEVSPTRSSLGALRSATSGSQGTHSRSSSQVPQHTGAPSRPKTPVTPDQSQRPSHHLRRTMTGSSNDFFGPPSSPPSHGRPVTPIREVSPGYIHRAQTPTGTKWSLKDLSPSQEALGAARRNESPRLGYASLASSQLSLASRMQQASVQSTPSDRGQGNEFPFPNVDSIDQNMMSMSAHRKNDVRRAQKPSMTIAVPDKQASIRWDPNVEETWSHAPGRKVRHMRSRGQTMQSNHTDDARRSEDSENANMAFASTRHAPEKSKASILREHRKPTVIKSNWDGGSKNIDLEVALSTKDPLQRLQEGDSPVRPSFESDMFSKGELILYAELRKAYADSIVLEKAARSLNKLYKSGKWPTLHPAPLTAQQHSNFDWAAEAAKLFREEARQHPIYQKFHNAGNDIAYRAKNDVRETAGSLPEIHERIKNWEEIDREEGVQVSSLVPHGQEHIDRVNAAEARQFHRA